MTTSEKWLPIPRWKGFYEVSSCGRVRSFDSYAKNPLTGGLSRRNGRILKPSIAGGYPHVWASRFGERERIQIHRCVAALFISPPPSARHQVNHKNGNKLDNTVENLEWVTAYENTRHARQTGLREKKLDIGDVISIRSLLVDGVSQGKVAMRFGVSQSLISRINGGERWAHI